MEPSCKTTAKQFYGEVIKDIIKNLQEHFIEEGINEDIIQELKHTWESKLLACRALSSPITVEKPQAYRDEGKTVPIQIVLPAQPQSNIKQKVLIVQVPTLALQGNQIYNVLSGPVISATMSLPQSLATSVLQQHMDAAFRSRQHAVSGGLLTGKSATQNYTGFQRKLVETEPKPSTSSLNQQDLDKNQFKEGKNFGKEVVNSSYNLYKTKKKKLKKS